MAANDDTDSVSDALSGQLHLALMVAGRFGETRARRLEHQHRNAQASSEQVAAELRVRLDAERSAARAAFLPSERADWLDRATPPEIGYAWEAATAWRDHDPDAAAALDNMRARLIERYGVDPATVTPDADALAEAVAARAEAGTERSAADATEAAVLVGDAELADEPEAAHAAAETRRDAAADLETTANADATEAVSLANTCQAAPPAHALRTRPASTTAPAAPHVPTPTRTIPDVGR